MSKELIEELSRYKKRHKITWAQLADKIGTTRLNLYRWRQANDVKGMGQKIVSEFLNQEKKSGSF